jgi:tetratricopeptide (TPR) repeat protein
LTKITPLNKDEQRVLLVNYLESVFKLSIPKEEIEVTLTWVQGYPRQIFYLAQVFSESGGSFAKVKSRSHDILSYGAEFANIAIQKYASNEKAKDVLALLACAVGIRKDFLIKAFNGDTDKIGYLSEFELMSICHSVGSSSEYILLDEALRDAVQRLRYKPNTTEYKILISEIRASISNANREDIFSKACYIEQQLISNKEINLEFVLPSHFIAAIKQSYHSQNYSHAISLCNRLYESGTSIDNHLIQIARFYDCMARIRKNEDISRLLMFHKEPERSFLRGFSARSKGDFKSALRDYKTAYEISRDYNYARNEYISLKIQMGETEEIIPIAKEEFNKSKNNIYVAQAYFNCLLSQFKKTSNTDTNIEVQRVLSYLPNVSDRKLLQMKSCMFAESAFYIEQNIDNALAILDECEQK